MLVWIFQSGEPIHTDSQKYRSMRAINLTNQLIASGHRVKLWTSNFEHNSKTFRYPKEKNIQINDSLEIEFLQSCGYSKNIGLKRILDHIQLAQNLNVKIRSDKKLPDVAFVGLPPLETAFVMSKFLKKQNIPFIADVKDMWPDIFYRAIPGYLKPLAKFIFFPFNLMLKQSLRSANGISTISQEFLDWSIHKAGRKMSPCDHVTYLNSPKIELDVQQIKDAEAFWKSIGIEADKKVKRVSFVGTLSDVFDFEPVIESLANSNFEFVIAGDGLQFDKLKSLEHKHTNLFVPGRLTISEIETLLRISDYFIIPLKDLPDFRSSLPNKFFDAINSELPILTSSEGTLKKTVLEEKIGFAYSGNQEKLIDLLKKIENVDTGPMISNIRNLTQGKFSYTRNYSELIDKLVRLSNAKQ